MTTALEGGEGSASRPGRSLFPGNTRYPLKRRLCGPQGRSGQVRKISPPPGFDPRTIQPVASPYTDWVTRPTMVYVRGLYYCSYAAVFRGMIAWGVSTCRRFVCLKRHGQARMRHCVTRECSSAIGHTSAESMKRSNLTMLPLLKYSTVK